MQTTDTFHTTSRAPTHPESVRHASSRYSRQRWDIRVVRTLLLRKAGLLLGTFVVLALATAAAGLHDYWRNLAQNTAADLSGALVFAYAITPIAQRRRSDSHEDGHADDMDLVATGEAAHRVAWDTATNTGNVMARDGGRAVSGIRRPPGRDDREAEVHGSGMAIARGAGSNAVSGIDYS